MYYENGESWQAFLYYIMSAKTKIGRPKLPKGKHKEVLSMRVTDAERRSYEAAAKKIGVGLREWMRGILNGAAE